MSNELKFNIFLMIMIPFLFVAVITPFIRKIAIKINAVDMPRTRHIHKRPTPKLGGVAIFLGFLLGYMIFGTHSSSMNAILIGSFLIILTGVVDDIVELGALVKLIGQTIAAAVVVFYGKILIQDVSAFGVYIDFGIFAYPLTLFFILGCVNCINFIDGIDGLSGGISAIYFLTIGIIATMQGKTGLDFVLTFVMFGSILGFLVYNFNPASIFAGDSGSMLMGFMISVVALFGFKNVTMTSFIIPLFVLAIPILDTLFAIIRRLLKGESIAKGDKFHIHHQLLSRVYSVKKTVIIIYFIDLLFAFASILYITKYQTLSYLVYSILLVLVIIFIWNTNVVFDRKELKKKITENFKKK